METKHFIEKSDNIDAPIYLNGSEASAWSAGYNAALQKTNALELLNFIEGMVWKDNFTDPQDKQEAINLLKQITEKP